MKNVPRLDQEQGAMRRAQVSVTGGNADQVVQILSSGHLGQAARGPRAGQRAAREHKN
jgi:hypothetical protein